MKSPQALLNPRDGAKQGHLCHTMDNNSVDGTCRSGLETSHFNNDADQMTVSEPWQASADCRAKASEIEQEELKICRRAVAEGEMHSHSHCLGGLQDDPARF